eukprot:gnl/MRDRNA2_/MRDRNA2_58119_c0_seq1.p1 gnl/MRDRNA2_/MRDRNA2_58119_c0~~gnl/MRDRNA2_/MRDRNA2_58119_c0_seq1.p1  ORF type:complete len:727 (-),score=151.70 gnl/MRDRNA2_/MRDRNA2_58119_c0_seq1:12-2192(-)
MNRRGSIDMKAAEAYGCMPTQSVRTRHQKTVGAAVEKSLRSWETPGASSPVPPSSPLQQAATPPTPQESPSSDNETKVEKMEDALADVVAEPAQLAAEPTLDEVAASQASDSEPSVPRRKIIPESEESTSTAAAKAAQPKSRLNKHRASIDLKAAEAYGCMMPSYSPVKKKEAQDKAVEPKKEEENKHQHQEQASVATSEGQSERIVGRHSSKEGNEEPPKPKRAVQHRASIDLKAAEAYGCMGPVSPPKSKPSSSSKPASPPSTPPTPPVEAEQPNRRSSRRASIDLDADTFAKSKEETGELPQPKRRQHRASIDLKAAEAYGCVAPSSQPKKEFIKTKTELQASTSGSGAGEGPKRTNTRSRGSIELRAMEAYGIVQTAAPKQAKVESCSSGTDSDDDDSLSLLGSAVLGQQADSIEKSRLYCTLMVGQGKDNVRKGLQDTLEKALTMRKRVDDMNGLVTTHRPKAGLFFELVSRAPILSLAVPKLAVRASIKADGGEEFVSVFSLESFVGFLAEARENSFWTSSRMMQEDAWRTWLTDACGGKSKGGMVTTVPWQQLADRHCAMQDEAITLCKSLRERTDAVIQKDGSITATAPKSNSRRAKSSEEERSDMPPLERLKVKGQLRKRLKALMDEKEERAKRVTRTQQENRKLETELRILQASQMAYRSSFGSNAFGPVAGMSNHSREVTKQSQSLLQRLEHCMALSHKNKVMKDLLASRQEQAQ